MESPRRSRLRWFALVVGVALTLPFVAIVLLQSGPARRWVWTQAQDYARTALAIDLQTDEFRYDLLAGTVDLGGFALRSSERMDLPALFEADSVALDFRLLELLRRTVWLETATLDGVRVESRFSQDGGDNMPRPDGPNGPDEPATPSRFAFHLSSLELDGTSIRLTHDPMGLDLTLPAWHMGIAGEDNAYAATIDITDGGSLARGESQLGVGPVVVNSEIAPNRLELTQLSVDSSVGTVRVSGVVNDLVQPVLDLMIEATVDSGMAAPLAGLTIPASGEIQTSAHLTGPPEALHVAGHTESAPFSIERFEAIDFEADWEWDAARNAISIEAMNATSPHGQIALAGALSLESAAPSSLRVDVAQLDLESISSALSLPFHIASTVTGRITADWMGLDWQSAGGGGRMDLASLGALAESVLPVSGALEARFEDGAMSLTVRGLETAGARINGDLDVGGESELEGAFSVELAEVGVTAEGIDRVLGGPAPDSVPMYPTGPLVLSSRLSGTVSVPAAEVSVESQSLSYGPIRGAELRADLAYREMLVEIQQSTLEWKGQIVQAQGTVAIEDAPLLDIRAEGEGLVISTVLEALDVDADLNGMVGIDSFVTGPMDDLHVEANLRVAGLDAYGQAMGDGTVNLNVDGDAVEFMGSFDGSEAAGDQDRISASGNYDMASTEFELDLEADQSIAGVSLGDVDNVGGRLRFSLEGDGTVEDPFLRVEASLDDAFIDSTSLGRVGFSAALEQQQLVWDLSAPVLGTTASGGLGIESPYPTSIEARLAALNLTLLDPLFANLDMAGALTATLTASGELERWQDAESRLDIDAVSVQVAGRNLSIDGPASIRFSDEQVHVDSLRLLAEGRALDIRGSLPAETPVPGAELQVQGDLDIGSLLTLSPLGGLLEATGRVNVDAAVGGSLRNPRPRFEVRWRDGTLRAPNLSEPFTNIDVELALDDQVVHLVTATGEWSGGRLDGNGSLPLALVSEAFPPSVEASAASFEAEMHNVPIESVPGVPSGLGGRADLHVEARASALTVDAIDATVRLDRLDLSLNDLNFTLETSAVLSIGDGIARLTDFALVGPQTRVVGDGELELVQGGMIRFDAQARTDTLVFSPSAGDIETTGRIDGELHVRGTSLDPVVSGTLRVDRAGVRMASPAIEVGDLTASIRMEPGALILDSFAGTLNGGSLEAGGTLAYSGTTPGALSLDVDFDEVAMETPEGLQTLSRGGIEIRTRGDLWVVGGGIEVLEGSYTNPFQVEQVLFDAVQSGEDDLETGPPNPLLARIRYDLSIDTLTPIVVDNDAAQIEATAQLRLTGSYENPGLAGRITVAEGSQIQIRESDFIIEQGVIDFANPNRIEPALDILAQTQAANYDITLQITGGGRERISTALTSEPPLPEPDVISVLLTGRTLDEIQGAEVNVATEQALSYVTGSLGGAISRGAEGALGLSQVRIEPTLIANESDPGARLTVGQNLSRNLELIYSMNLVDSSDQIWVAEYDVTRRFVVKSTKQDDNTYRFDLSHDFQIGAPATGALSGSPRAVIRNVQSIEIEPSVFEGRDLGRIFGVEAGDRYLFFDLRRGIDRLTEFFSERDYLEVRVRVERQVVGNEVDLQIVVDTGPRLAFEFVGFPISGSLRDDIRDVWGRAAFDAFRLDQGTLEIRQWLVGRGYFQALVEASAAINDAVKTVRFQIDAGRRYRRLEIDFQGANGLDPVTLSSDLDDAGLSGAVVLDPPIVERFISGRYRDRGYLDARVLPFEYDFQAEAGRARVTISIEEGPVYEVGAVVFSGNRRFSGEELDRSLQLRGLTYSGELLREAGGRLEQLYWEAGFNDVIVERSAMPDTEDAVVDIAFGIRENQQGAIQDIDIAGTRRTSEDFVRSQLELETGSVLNFEQLNLARRRLYFTGAYSLVDVQTVEIDGQVGADGVKPVGVRVNLREVAPYTFQYGAFFDTERGLGLVADFKNRNSLGSARVLGLRSRYDSDLRELRGYFSQPLVRGLPLSTDLAGFLRREFDSDAVGDFITDRWGVSVQQEVRLAGRLNLSYGYRYERAHTYEPVPDPLFPFDITLAVAPLTLSLNRDTRDDILDASRGSFTSHAIEYATRPLGSDLKLLKYFGQYNQYFPLSAPSLLPFSGGIEKVRLVFASSTRLGVAAGLGGDEVPPSERFFAGGGTSMRGFREDALGPTNFFGDHVGGEAVFLINNELRFPIFSIFDGVSFLDVGNLYSRISDLTLRDLRSTAGFGLRVRTPYFLLRADYGLKLDRRTDERVGTFFFSIGQAF